MTNFHGDDVIFFLLKKKFKMTDSKKVHFSKLPILKIFLWKFHGLVLWLVELIDAKGIDLSQPIWLWGCPTKSQKQPKNAFSVILRIGDFEKCTFFESVILNFFFCFFPMKISQSLLVSKDGSKFWSSQTWQHFLTHTKHSWGECTIYSILLS